MGGCLGAFHAQWHSLFPQSFAAKVLEEGYFPKFVSSPPLTTSPRPMDPKKGQQSLITPALEELLTKGALELVRDPSTPGWYSRIFLVPKASGGMRTVIDLSSLNKYLDPPQFSMTKNSDVRSALHKGLWAASVDLKDAYFQVPIHPAARKFFRVAWGGKVYQFKALPFGLSTAPWLFTLIVKPLVAHMHALGFQMFAYLDDWLVIGESREACQKAVDSLVTLAVSLGFRINYDKSELTPSQKFVFLGMEFDLTEGLLRPTLARLAKISDVVSRILNQPVSAREWLSFLGLLNATYDMVDLGRLKGRPLQRFLASQWKQSSGDLRDVIPVPREQETISHLKWWLRQDLLRKGVSLEPWGPSILVFTDASHFGWGGHVGEVTARGHWSPEEKKAHINLLEMWAVDRTLRELSHLLAGQHVALATDNTTVLAYLKNQGGTRSPSLSQAAARILFWCRRMRIKLSVRHLAGKRNVLADALSRSDRPIPSEWSLHPQVAKAILDLWGNPLIDLFATCKNHRTPLYVSPFPDEKAWGVDALSIRWDNLTAYAYPPTGLIAKVLEILTTARDCTIILIAPKWPAQKWYPRLLSFLTDRPRRLPSWNNLVSQPGFKTHPNIEWLALHAWRLSSNPSHVEDFLNELQASSTAPPGPRQQPSMTENGQPSRIGVLAGVQIHSLPLWPN